MAGKLAEGIYEHLVTEGLASALDELGSVERRLDKVLDSDAAPLFARHLAREIERVLASLPNAQRAETARAVASTLLHVLGEIATAHKLDARPIADQRIAEPAQRLLAIYRASEPERPATPLTTSTLLTRAPSEPAIGYELSREISTADRIDIIVAFITVGGIRRIHERLEQFARRGDGLRLRVLTTTFTGTTERAALDLLAALPGSEIKVSYDTRRTRLHAKAWLFHRDNGLSTAYVGSANLTSTALGDGHEWMVKLCAADLPDVIGKFAGTFDTLWLDPEFETYDPGDDSHRTRLATALGAQRESSTTTTLVELRPYPFQEEILDRLAAARVVSGRRRNLLVAATGTGKTVIAAVDYARIAAAAGVRPRLLFLAHRREILERARDTFRHALYDGSFGELQVGGATPTRFEHVFCSIQSAARLIERVGPQHFRHVVVDECHHLPAESYQTVVPTLDPDQLVGLTATPERSDGKSLLPDFDGHVTAELRLWHALERELLAPFDYYGLSDGVDLRRVRWSRAGYDMGALGDIYTGHDARADLVLAQLGRRVADVRGVRALGFCVSIDHAEFMAEHFTRHGVPSRVVHGGTEREVRDDAPRALREREVNVLFTCDLYNEGVDLPFVDTLLLLRPTMSATLFLQQLGRGLRLDRASGKTSCLVLDFIGQHREEFRFDGILSALTGVPRGRIGTAVKDGFPYLPSGCSVVLDAVARDTILESLKATVANAARVAADLRDVAARSTGPVRLSEFLAETGRELGDVYKKAYGWTKIRRLAGVDTHTDEESEDLSRRLGWLTHIDEPSRLRTYLRAVRATHDAISTPLSEFDRVRVHMLEHQLQHRGTLRAAEDTLAYLAERADTVQELHELGEVLEDRVPLPDDRYPVSEWPLALHRHYSRREIVAAVGFVGPGVKAKVPQGGILKFDDQRRELLFVTLDKSGSGFSPTTRYRDYATAHDRFHWETQSAASVTRPSGRRYVEADSDWSFYLFVRTDPAAPYAFLGPVAYESHAGDRPIGITWKLAFSMPAALYDRYATLASP